MKGRELAIDCGKRRILVPAIGDLAGLAGSLLSTASSIIGRCPRVALEGGEIAAKPTSPRPERRQHRNRAFAGPSPQLEEIRHRHAQSVIQEAPSRASR